MFIWSKYIILGKEKLQKTKYSLKGVERYLLSMVLILIGASVVTLPILVAYKVAEGFFSGGAGGALLLGNAAVTITGVAALWLMLKVSFVLVESAIGIQSGGFQWSWSTTAPLNGRFLGTAIVAGVVVVARIFLAFLIAEMLVGQYAKVVLAVAVQTIALMLLAAFLAAVMSLAYGRLVGEHPDQFEPAGA